MTPRRIRRLRAAWSAEADRAQAAYRWAVEVENRTSRCIARRAIRGHLPSPGWIAWLERDMAETDRRLAEWEKVEARWDLARNRPAVRQVEGETDDRPRPTGA